MKILIGIIGFFVMAFQMNAQCNHAIPSSSVVVNTNTTNNSGFSTLWVCSSDTLISNGGIRNIFLEAGAVMYTAGGIDSIYVKNGAKLIMTGGIHKILYENISDLTLSGGISTTVSCSTITFDYSNAPSNGCAPILPVSASIVNIDPICAGQCNGSLTASASSGLPPYTYKWLGGPNTASYTNVCAGTYTLIVTDVVNNVDTEITVLQDPPIIDTSITAGACQMYSFAGFARTVSGIYTDTLTSKDGCDSIITLTLTINPVSTGVIKNGTTLTANEATANYQWLDCDNGMIIISGSTNRSLIGSVYSSYAVIVSNDVCTDTSDCYSINPLNIASQDKKTGVKVYPNPVNNVMYIEFPEAFQKDLFTITDLKGRLVMEDYLNGTSTNIDLSDLNPGLYILRIEGNYQTTYFIKD